jgi:hypothetical protein
MGNIRGIIEYKILRGANGAVFELQGTWSNNKMAGEMCSEIIRAVDPPRIPLDSIAGNYAFLYFDNHHKPIQGKVSIHQLLPDSEYKIEWSGGSVRFEGRGYCFGTDRFIVNYWD